MLADTFPDPLDSVLFLNSGSEAIDGALKLARRVTGRPGIIAFRGAFHGRTFGATSVTTSNINYRTGYEPLLPGVYFAPFPAVYRDFGGDEAAATASSLAILGSLLKTVIAPSQVAAILIEPVQGEGGYYPAPAAFLQGLRALCDEHGILLIADEVQSGYGRTGEMWAFEHAGHRPRRRVRRKGDRERPAAVGDRDAARARQAAGAAAPTASTFGGNPVACAAGVAVLETIRDERPRGERPGARRASSRGGLRELMADDPAHRRRPRPGPDDRRRVRQGPRDPRAGRRRPPRRWPRRATEAGLILLTCGIEHQVIRWIPPLDVTVPEVEEALRIFEGALAG